MRIPGVQGQRLVTVATQITNPKGGTEEGSNDGYEVMGMVNPLVVL